MFKKELSNEDISKLKETIRTKLREKKIEEENTTASADGYNIPVRQQSMGTILHLHLVKILMVIEKEKKKLPVTDLN